MTVTQRGARWWEVGRWREVYKGCNDYLLLGRVVELTAEEGGGYRVDLPMWQEVGHAWHELPRTFTTRQAALRYLDTMEGKRS